MVSGTMEKPAVYYVRKSLPKIGPHLICNGNAALDVKETIRVSTVDLINDVDLLNPFRAYLAQSFFIIWVPLR